MCDYLFSICAANRCSVNLYHERSCLSGPLAVYWALESENSHPRQTATALCWLPLPLVWFQMEFLRIKKKGEKSRRPLHVWCSSCCTANESWAYLTSLCQHFSCYTSLVAATAQSDPSSPHQDAITPLIRPLAEQPWQDRKGVFLYSSPDKRIQRNLCACACVWVCERVQSVFDTLAKGVTNCLLCNQPLLACCSHQT